MKCSKCKAEIVDDSRFCGKCGSPIRTGEENFISQTLTILKSVEEFSPETLLVGKYRIIEVVGRGGMGIVHKAEDTKLRRNVALKFLPPELVRDHDARGRFVQEARAAAALSHPNICTIHEINDEGERPFISMEFIEGRSLKACLERDAFDAGEAVEIAIQVAEGLKEAHRKGIIHRDIKSANIMITEGGQAKIMDFGLAKVKGGTPFTREGTTLGTVAYMSPEQARGEEVDHRTDIWSLGIVLYEMLAGCLPFKGDREASVLYSVVHEEPKPLKSGRPGLPVELQRIVDRALKKNPEARTSSASELSRELREYRDSVKAEEIGAFSLKNFLRAIRRPRIAIPAGLICLVAALAAVWFINRQAKLSWARNVALPEAERLWKDDKYTEAYRLAEKAAKLIPNDPKLAEIYSNISVNIAVKTEPPGARILMKDYRIPDGNWRYLGLTPIANVRVPADFLRWKIEKEGYDTVLAAWPSYDAPFVLERKLDEKGILPDGMVRVPATETDAGKIPAFFIDRYEVTNKQYKAFADGGGYQDPKYWKHTFVQDGKSLSREEAMARFIDQSGRPGPATWQAGDYPEGQDDYPVSGISWYEAAAYAEFVGKSLPSSMHWSISCGSHSSPGKFPGIVGYLLQSSNFRGEGPAPVGEHSGMTLFGASDMAGNVREWCSSETSVGRVVRGGGWNDATYMFLNLSQAPSFDRSPKNGLRCTLYGDPESIPEKVFQPVVLEEVRDFTKEKPVPDSVFQVYKNQFSYDKKELKPLMEWRKEDSRDWVQEKINFEAAYGGERIVAYLFLPKNAAPPFQTVIYFPGSGSVWTDSSANLEKYGEFVAHLSHFLKNKRAVLYPVYKGAFERRNADLEAMHPGADSYQFTEYLIQLVKDLKRSIDYLETRPEIDSQKLAYLGFSWGGLWSNIIPAVEERLKVCMTIVGGIWARGRPEANELSYVRQVKIPFLMLNGRYDVTFIYELHVRPMFNLLGTPDTDKKLVLYDTDHYVPINGLIKETLAWLDKYFGPAR